MLDALITALSTEDSGLESPADTRERLKDLFPRSASRRMTQLGQLVGATLNRVGAAENEPIVYASAYGETRALESYLESFPSPSPTLFQTSIHPSGVQQALVARQQPIRELFPLTGSHRLTARALEVALLTGAPRTLLCGGEERGTWMLEYGAASDRTFAFALALTPATAASSDSGALGRLQLGRRASALDRSDPTDPTDPTDLPSPPRLPLPEFFELLRTRRPFNGPIASGRWLTLTWN